MKLSTVIDHGNRLTLPTTVGLHRKCHRVGVGNQQKASQQCQFLNIMYVQVLIFLSIMSAFKCNRNKQYRRILIDSNANKYPWSPAILKTCHNISSKFCPQSRIRSY